MEPLSPLPPACTFLGAPAAAMLSCRPPCMQPANGSAAIGSPRTHRAIRAPPHSWLCAMQSITCGGSTACSAPPSKQAAARPQCVAANQGSQAQLCSQASAPVKRHARRAMRSPTNTCAAASGAGDAASKVNETGLPRTAVIGVLGGGQLGKMMGQEAVSCSGGGGWAGGWGGAAPPAQPGHTPFCQHHHMMLAPLLQAKMGVTLRVLDPTPACPASTVAAQMVGSFRDPDAVREFAKGCDVLTVEIEHIDADAMQVGLRMRGSSATLCSAGGWWPPLAAAASSPLARCCCLLSTARPSLLAPRPCSLRHRRLPMSLGLRWSPPPTRFASSKTSSARSSTLRRRGCHCPSTGRLSAASAQRGRGAPLGTHTCSRARREWALRLQLLLGAG